MSAKGPTCALARFSYMGSTPAKAHNKRYLSGPFLRRDLVPFYAAIDSASVKRLFRICLLLQKVEQTLHQSEGRFGGQVNSKNDRLEILSQTLSKFCLYR